MLTGFEPFGDWQVNPTAVAAKELDRTKIGDFEVIGRILPLKYLGINPTLEKLVKGYLPKAIVLSGQAGGSSIRLEKLTRNEAKSRIPYNCGTMTNGELIEPKGPITLESNLPLALIYDKLIEDNIPVSFSDEAGLFGCNQAFYHARFSFPDIPSGFIHVPMLPTQVSEKEAEYMEQDIITKALLTALNVIADQLGDQL